MSWKTLLVIVLTSILTCAGTYADSDSHGRALHGGKKEGAKRITPASKYHGQEKSNNGHGNNEDGVDSSNPGNNKKDDTDPHKKTDSDPDVDDEKK